MTETAPVDGRTSPSGSTRTAASSDGFVPRRRAPVLIDARATARREIGGVERVAREMATLLPRLRPDRYAVMRPPGALAHRAGHVWEQALLPAVARPEQLLYCPANLAPAASRRTVVVIHDLAPLRHPSWYSRTFTSYQRYLCLLYTSPSPRDRS